MSWTKRRGFEVAKGYEDMDIQLPIRSTKTSAGFDFEAAEDVYIQPLWKQIMKGARRLYTDNDATLQDVCRPTKIPTGIKAYMEDDEGLFLHSRSSLSFKRMLMLADGVGLVDSDFYENPKDDGAIFLQFINFGLFTVKINKGERIGQGVFQKYLDADEGKARKLDKIRAGGSGTT